MLRNLPHPVRTWRSTLVVACLIGATVVGAVLVAEVHAANAAVQATAARTLRDYASYAGRVLGTELFRRSANFRTKLYGPVANGASRSGTLITLDDFAHWADSIYASEGYEPDPLRGYIRLDLRTGRWQGVRAMTDSSRAKVVVDTLMRRRLMAPNLLQSGLVILPAERGPMTASYVSVADTATHHVYVYAVTQTRAVNFLHAIDETLRFVPLLPPSFAGSEWDVDAPPTAAHALPNDSLIAVRVVGVDGTVLYASPHWFNGPHRGSYQFQTGPGGFTIETVLRPGLENRLVPGSVRSAGRSLYIAFAIFGAILIAVSFIAFWGEMARVATDRTRSIRQLTNGLRHELNNALATVLLEAQLLATDDNVSGETRATGSSIAEQAERMRDALRKLDHVDQLPVVNYLENESMVDLTPAPKPPPPAQAAS